VTRSSTTASVGLRTKAPTARWGERRSLSPPTSAWLQELERGELAAQEEEGEGTTVGPRWPEIYRISEHF
jgi:hypothetical protein